MRKSNCAHATRLRLPQHRLAVPVEHKRASSTSILVALLAIVVGSVLNATTWAEEGFPHRPIRIVVYTGPGGLLDTMARKFVDVGRKYTTATMYVENRPGAGGIVAFDSVVQGPADGYTWLAVTKSNVAKLLIAQREELFESLDWRAMLVVDPECLIVAKNSGLTSLADWEFNVKQSGGTYRNWLGPAMGGLDHVTAAKIWNQLHVRGEWIPYTSGGEAISALLGGQGRVYVGNPSDASSNPDLHVVAISSPQRLAEYPDVPTMGEAGLVDLDHQFMWRGFAVKRGCPPTALQWFDRLCEQVSQDDDWRAFWQDEGAQVAFFGPEQTTKQLLADRDEFATYHRELGLSAAAPSTKTFRRQWEQRMAIFLLAIVAWIPTLRATASRHRISATSSWLIPLLLQSLFIVMFWRSTSLRPGGILGAASLPQLWLSLGVALSPSLVMRGIDRNQNSESPANDARQMVVWGFIALSLGYFVGLATIGFYLASAAALVTMMWWLGYRRWTFMAGTASSWLLFVYWGLERTLHLSMPRGWWAS